MNNPHQKGYWYCPECNTRVHPLEVTWEETHEDCGATVTWIAPGDPDYYANEIMVQIEEESYDG